MIIFLSAISSIFERIFTQEENTILLTLKLMYFLLQLGSVRPESTHPSYNARHQVQVVLVMHYF